MRWRNRPPQRMRCPVLGRVFVGVRRVAESEKLQKTPLHALHVALGAKMVGFGGYDMPVQYPAGILAEHLHTRSAAGLFDVSHMGQVTLRGPNAVAALETLVPGDLAILKEGVSAIRCSPTKRAASSTI